MQYTEYSFHLEPKEDLPSTMDVYDILCSYLSEIHFDSFCQSNDSLLAYIPKEKQPSDQQLKAYLADFPISNATFSFSAQPLEDLDWNEEWEKNSFQPILIKNKIYIRAPFHSSIEEDKIQELLINPKMAFGTGTHQTTNLIAEYLIDESDKLEDKTILDIGCGTGILSILALMLDANSAMAIDIDPWAYENTIENAQLNQVSDKLNVLCGDASAAKGLPDYDYVIANITRNVLMQDMPIYNEHLKKGGKLILSGFLESDVNTLVAKGVELGLHLKEVLREDDWRAIVFKKK